MFLRLQINPPDIHGEIALSLLNQIMGYSGNEIHFAADKWLTPSIKDIEHTDRGAISTACEISVPPQKR